MSEYLYDAFISYSHRDMKWAKWLQHRLETFVLPADIREARADDGGHLRIFRDQTDLAGVELQASLRRAMDQSRCLIVLCSPESAKSRWVGDEIRYFKSLNRGDRIIPFVVSGEPESDHTEQECYHEELRNVPDKHFLGANVQELGRNKAFLRLMAILLDVRFDRLVNRARQRRRRAVLITGVLLAVVLIVVSTLSWYNYRISKENEGLSRDAYGKAMISSTMKDAFEAEDVEILKVSAEAGSDEAMLYLAYCYENGLGTEKDLEAAFAWFMKAAEAGKAEGMAALGNCYANGLGVERDETLSFEWYMRAAEAGNSEAMLNIGLYYESGFGVEANLATAFDYFLMSANAGNANGMYNTLICYLIGNGTEANPEEAFNWTVKLAEKNDVRAMYLLGAMYQSGSGTEENPELAYTWYKRAAEAGDPNAMFMTGWCIENRYGVEDAALEWYRKAAELGNEQALQRIQDEESADTPDDRNENN